MIVVDANVFLRFLVRPQTSQGQRYAQAAAMLFGLVELGRETITTSDAVIAEVVFILSSKRHYNTPRDDVVARLRPLLQMNGCKFPRKQLCLRALDLWLAAPKLSFVDALTVVQADETQAPLASFDSELFRVSGVAQWQPPPGSGTV